MWHSHRINLTILISKHVIQQSMFKHFNLTITSTKCNGDMTMINPTQGTKVPKLICTSSPQARPITTTSKNNYIVLVYVYTILFIYLRYNYFLLPCLLLLSSLPLYGGGLTLSGFLHILALRKLASSALLWGGSIA